MTHVHRARLQGANALATLFPRRWVGQVQRLAGYRIVDEQIPNKGIPFGGQHRKGARRVSRDEDHSGVDAVRGKFIAIFKEDVCVQRIKACQGRQQQEDPAEEASAYGLGWGQRIFPFLAEGRLGPEGTDRRSAKRMTISGSRSKEVRSAPSWRSTFAASLAVAAMSLTPTTRCTWRSMTEPRGGL